MGITLEWRRRTARAGVSIIFIAAIALAFACKNSAGSSSNDSGDEGTAGPSVALGAQSGQIAVGVAGTATFSAATTNIETGTVGTVAWYATQSGTTTASAPAGITATVSAVAGNAATVTITATTAAIQGSYYFKLTEGSTVSSVAALRVADWEFVGAEGFTAGDSDYLSLKLDSKDTPYLAYSDGGASKGATATKYVGGSWSTLGVSNFSSGAVQHVCLALGSDDTPIVAANYDSAVAWKYNSASSSWTSLGAYSSDMGLYNSMALDASGNIYIAFMETDFGDKARVVCNKGSGWTDIGSSTGISSGEVSYVSLALDSKGIPLVAYVDIANGSGITVLKYDGSSAWSPLGTAGGVSAGGQTVVAFAMGPGDIPYVAYLDTANSYKTTVKKYDSSTSSWSTVGSSAFGSNGSYYCCPSLAISSTGAIYLAFTDGALARATVIKYEAASGTWTNVGRRQLGSVEADRLSLALDSSGAPYLAFCDVDNYKASVMRFR